MRLRDVGGRDPHLHAQVEGGARGLAGRLPAQLQDRLLEQLHVEVEPDRLDVAALLAAEQVAGAAQLEVEGGDAEAGAEVGELADRGEALARDLGEHGVGRDQEVGEGPPVGAAHPAAQLVELGEAVAVGAVHDQGVRARDVEAVLDDGGRHQHVRAPLHEGEHHALELRLRHLPVGDRDPRLRHQALHEARQGVDRLDPVVDEEDLALAAELLADGGRDHVGRELHDRGLDGEPVARAGSR